MKVATANEFIAFFKATGELPEFESGNLDDVLANTLMQIKLNTMDDNHYVPLADLMIERFQPYDHAPFTIGPIIQRSLNRIMTIAIQLEMKLSDDMIKYYCAKSCEELGIGDMDAAGVHITYDDNLDDNYYIVKLYKDIKLKAKAFNLYELTVEEHISAIDTELLNLVTKYNKIGAEINALSLRKLELSGLK